MRFGLSMLVLAALLGALPLVTPSDAQACPRCSRDSASESLIDGRFVSFDAERRILRVRVRDGDAHRVAVYRVGSDVRPRRGDDAIAWSALARGQGIQIVVRSERDERAVIRVMVQRRERA